MIYTAFALINLTAYGADVETDLPDNLETTSLKRLVQVTLRADFTLVNAHFG